MKSVYEHPVKYLHKELIVEIVVVTIDDILL